MKSTGKPCQWYALLIGLLVAACSSPEEKVELSTRAARSWEATVRQTSRALEQGTVPPVYARQILRAAVDHERAQRGLPEWQKVPPEVRARLVKAVDQLNSSLDPRQPTNHE